MSRKGRTLVASNEEGFNFVPDILRVRYHDLLRAYRIGESSTEADGIRAMLHRQPSSGFQNIDEQLFAERAAVANYTPSEGEDWHSVSPHMRRRKFNSYFALGSMLLGFFAAVAVFVWIMVCYNHKDWINQKYVYRTSFATGTALPHVIHFQYSTGPQDTFYGWGVFAALSIGVLFIFILGIVGTILLELMHRWRGIRTDMETRSWIWAPVRYYMDQLAVYEIDFIQFGVSVVIFTLNFFLFMVANARQDILELIFLTLLMPFQASILRGFIHMSEFNAQNFSRKTKFAMLHHHLSEGPDDLVDIDFYHFLLAVELAEDIHLAKKMHIFQGLFPFEGSSEKSASRQYLRHFVRNISFPHFLYLFLLCAEFTYSTWILFKYPSSERYAFIYAVWVIMYLSRFLLFLSDTVHMSPEGHWKRRLAKVIRAIFYWPFRFVHQGFGAHDNSQMSGYLLDDVYVRVGFEWWVLVVDLVVIPALYFVYTVGTYAYFPMADTYP